MDVVVLIYGTLERNNREYNNVITIKERENVHMWVKLRSYYWWTNLKNNTQKDWTGNKNSIFKTLGASNHTDKERQNEDYYATDPIAIDVLLKDGGGYI